MDLKYLCRQDFQEYVQLAQIPEDLKRALRSHERVPLFIDNMASEFQKVPFHVDRETIKKTVYDFTEIFLRNVMRVADERAMSDLAKQAMIDKAKEMAEADLLADSFNEGSHVEVSEKGETDRATIKV